MKVLIVDDSTYNLFVIESLIKEYNQGCEITLALNGRIALDKVKVTADSGVCIYSFIFLDIQMPVMDGISVRIYYVDYSSA